MTRNLNHKVPSSALGYAISFLLLIGLICAGIIFISSTNKRIEINYEMEEHLLFNNYFALNYGAKKQESGTLEIIHPSGDTTQITVRDWGAYRAIVARSFHGNKQVEKSAIFGYETLEQYPTLYIPDNRQVIKLCGKTIIEGNVYTSERGFERGHIARKAFEGDRLFDGSKHLSEKKLPTLKNYISEIGISMFRADAVKIESVDNDSLFRFTEPTTLWTSTRPIVLTHRIEGNIVIHSFDSIYVAAVSRLENVILIAPVIHIEKGFSGNFQAIADKRITCEENVTLNYPSSLILHVTEKTEEHHQIYLGNSTRVIGGVLLISDYPDYRNPVYLNIDEATVGGLVYNQGTTELKGNVIGSVYTSAFGLKTGGGEYTNYLLDATISMKQLPREFVMPNWLHEENGPPILLTCF